MSQDEYVARALGLYTSQTQSPAQARMRDRVRTTFDSFYGQDELYENAKGRGKKKLKKWWNKAKDNIKQAADKVSDAAKEVGKVAAQAALVAPRQAARGLIELNYRGLASKMNNLKPDAKEKLLKNWSKAGGERGKLEESIEQGRKKKPFACGKKCRAKVKDKGFDGIDFYSITGAEIAALVGAGMGLLSGVIKGLLDRKNMKDQQEFDLLSKELDGAEGADDASTPPVPPPSPEEALAADPRTAIQNNPNLTEDEKTAAIAQLNNVLGSPSDIINEGGGMSKQTKMILIGLGVVAVLGLAYAMLKGKKSS